MGWSYLLLLVPIYQKSFNLLFLIRLKICGVNITHLLFFSFFYNIWLTTDCSILKMVFFYKIVEDEKNKFIFKNMTQSERQNYF